MPMQLTEQEENELICEKLLGWKRLPRQHIAGVNWRTGDGRILFNTTTFTDWASAGLILDAMATSKCKTAVGDKSISGGWWCTIDAICQLRDTGPLAIRASALAYIRSAT